MRPPQTAPPAAPAAVGLIAWRSLTFPPGFVDDDDGVVQGEQMLLRGLDELMRTPSAVSGSGYATAIRLLMGRSSRRWVDASQSQVAGTGRARGVLVSRAVAGTSWRLRTPFG